jgi:carboxyl-terminal processing protease
LSAQEVTNQQNKKDFGYFWTIIKTNYCYWDKNQSDWDKIKAIYSALTDTITSKRSFVLLLEKVFYELYDHHASLSTNTSESQRLIYSSTDLRVESINEKPIITEVR